MQAKIRVQKFAFAAAALVLAGTLVNAAPAQAYDGTYNAYKVAVFSALDKITAQISRLEVPLNEKVSFGTLDVLVHSCKKRPPEEPPETTAFVEVFEKGLAAPGGAEARHGEENGRSALTDVVSRISEYSEQDVAPNQLTSPSAQAGQDGQQDSEGMLAGKPAGAVDPSQPGRIFSGWMFASSPGLNAVEHPVYDVWLTDCKTPSGETSSGSE